MVYKVLKINYGAKNVANYVCNHGTKFESFAAIILWLVLDKIRGVKCWWGAGPQTFDLVLYASTALLPHAESEDSYPNFLNVTQLSEIVSATTVFSDEHTQCYKELRVCKINELYPTSLREFTL